MKIIDLTEKSKQSVDSFKTLDDIETTFLRKVQDVVKDKYYSFSANKEPTILKIKTAFQEAIEDIKKYESQKKDLKPITLVSPLQYSRNVLDQFYFYNTNFHDWSSLSLTNNDALEIALVARKITNEHDLIRITHSENKVDLFLGHWNDGILL